MYGLKALLVQNGQKFPDVVLYATVIIICLITKI